MINFDKIIEDAHSHWTSKDELVSHILMLANAFLDKQSENAALKEKIKNLRAILDYDGSVSRIILTFRDDKKEHNIARNL